MPTAYPTPPNCRRIPAVGCDCCGADALVTPGPGAMMVCSDPACPQPPIEVHQIPPVPGSGFICIR